MRGELELAGTRRPASFELTAAADGRVRGTLPVTQSEWGIKPYRGMMGALKVRDTVEVVLDVPVYLTAGSGIPRQIDRGRARMRRMWISAAGGWADAVARRPRPPAGRATLGIEVLSNRADIVSAGDVLVAVDLPAGVAPWRWVSVADDGRDVTGAFALRRNGRFDGARRRARHSAPTW